MSEALLSNTEDQKDCNAVPSRKIPRRSSRPTRKEALVRLLSRKAGADVPTICKSFGWQPRSARAAMTGLRNAGYEIASDTPAGGKPRRYRIVGTPERAG